MFHRKYGHGHSAALGFLLALSLQRHALTFAVLVFLAGLIAGRAWATWALWASALREKWHLSKREPINTRPVPVYTTKPRGARADDGVPF